MQNDNNLTSARRLNYIDFEVEIGRGKGHEYGEYPVTVVRSSAGEARETMHFPFDESTLESHLKDLQIELLRSGGGRRRLPSPQEQTAQDFGRSLFDALLTGEVRSRYDVSWREAAEQGRGLRLKLRIQPPELAALPWEFIYDSRQAEYVSLSRNTPVVRYLELPQPIHPLAVRLPLRILGMVASPQDLPPLDVAQEKRRVARAVKGLRARALVDLTWLEGQTWRDLQQAMRGGPWHVFHFIGHGGFDLSADEGFIALADERGRTDRLSATQLGRLLADHRSLRLALLNSCEGARGSERDVFSSAAAILVRRGIPAVLAMQYEITDQAAVEFSRTFYETLADGMPVDAAVTEARKAISVAEINTVEWAAPVLYMRSPDGVLFDVQGQEAVHRPPPPRLGEVWDRLRRLPAAAWAGLAAVLVLLIGVVVLSSLGGDGASTPTLLPTQTVLASVTATSGSDETPASPPALLTPVTQEFPTPTAVSALPILLHTSLDDIEAIHSPSVGLGGATTLTVDDFVPSQFGKGAAFVREGQDCTAPDLQHMAFPVARAGRENVNLDRGELEFWYQPNYDTVDPGGTRAVFNITHDGYNPPFLLLAIGAEGRFSLSLVEGHWIDHTTSTNYGTPLWKAGEWVHIRAAWDNAHPTDSLRLYVNGTRVDGGGVAGGWSLEPENPENELQIIVGAQTPCGDSIADGVIDELIIRGEPAVASSSAATTPVPGVVSISGDCFERFFHGIPEDRVITLEEGLKDTVLIGPEQSKDGIFALKFTENREPIGALILDFFSDGEIFRLGEIVDAACQQVEEYSVEGRPGEKGVLQNWDTVQIPLGEHAYSLRLGYDAGVIRLDGFRRVSSQ